MFPVARSALSGFPDLSGWAWDDVTMDPTARLITARNRFRFISVFLRSLHHGESKSHDKERKVP